MPELLDSPSNDHQLGFSTGRTALMDPTAAYSEPSESQGFPVGHGVLPRMTKQFGYRWKIHMVHELPNVIVIHKLFISVYGKRWVVMDLDRS